LIERGACYIVYGQRAAQEAAQAIGVLRWSSNPNLPITVIGDDSGGEKTHIAFPDKGMPGRWAKVNLYWLSPYQYTCYLDADTRVYENLSFGFAALQDGWDIIIPFSTNQQRLWLKHIGDEERRETRGELGFCALQLQAGAFWFGRNERLEHFFEAWRSEWGRWQGQDQAALLRALYQVPIKIWLLGQPWCNGEAIRHLFGRLH